MEARKDVEKGGNEVERGKKESGGWVAWRKWVGVGRGWGGRREEKKDRS